MMNRSRAVASHANVRGRVVHMLIAGAAMLDVSRVLTPEQRVAIGARIQERGGARRHARMNPNARAEP